MLRSEVVEVVVVGGILQGDVVVALLTVDGDAVVFVVGDAADYELTPAYPTSRLTENKSNSIFLIEANHDTADYINGLLRLQLIDEIILYTVPFIAGTGQHLFKANLPSSHWDLVEKKEYNGSILRTIYRKKCIQE